MKAGRSAPCFAARLRMVDGGKRPEIVSKPSGVTCFDLWRSCRAGLKPAPTRLPLR
jgi:hypothetical protein